MGWEGAGSSVGRRPVNDCGLRTSSFCQTNLLSFLRPPRRTGYYVISLLLHLLDTSISASAQESKKRFFIEIVFPPCETLLRLVATSIIIDHQACAYPTADNLSGAIEIVTIADPSCWETKSKNILFCCTTS